MAVVVGPRPGLEVLLLGAEIEVQPVGVGVFLGDFDLCFEDGNEALIAMLEEVLPDEDRQVTARNLLFEESP